jgi:undecaprenyl-diphosphatase
MTRTAMPPRTRVALVLFAAVLALGLWVYVAGTPFFDEPLSHALSPARSQPDFWRAMTFLGDWQVRIAIGLAAALWLGWRTRALTGFAFLAVLAVQGLTNSGLKMLFARPRPELFDHLDYTWDLSFPSGHAAQNACLWLLVALLIDRRLLWIGVPLAFLIGVSRVVLGVHWPSDVLGGWAAGAAFALAGADIVARASGRS